MSITGRDYSRKVCRAVSKFTQNQLLGKNRLRRDFNVLMLQPAISFILCWEWEREIRFRASEVSDSQFSVKKEFTTWVSDLKLYLHIFPPFPPSFFYKEDSEGHPEMIGWRGRSSRCTALINTHSFLAFMGCIILTAGYMFLYLQLIS